MEKLSDDPKLRGVLQSNQSVLFKNVKVMRDKERPKQRSLGRRRELSALWDPELDPRTERGP